ncbi:hypothetical protein HPB51_029456 [Rhipicephalus microplus]|uniref:Nose resistant-to-fluoxetine protein N-terminal domain-containing protein n=1 Tax=Rhipicephalus microplus TaxID=6941 RepID=A0A9J6CUG8_RHIMP|nr:hypothetical protein HPB51_029456 [Rhipicephalus microplus]
MGRPPAGLLEGSMGALGSYDECLSIAVPGADDESIAFRGQYCTLYVKPELNDRWLDVLQRSLDQYPLPVRKRLKNVTNLKQFYGHWLVGGMRLGVCLPSACSGKDLKSTSSGYMKGLDVAHGRYRHCHCCSQTCSLQSCHHCCGPVERAESGKCYGRLDVKRYETLESSCALAHELVCHVADGAWGVPGGRVLPLPSAGVGTPGGRRGSIPRQQRLPPQLVARAGARVQPSAPGRRGPGCEGQHRKALKQHRARAGDVGIAKKVGLEVVVVKPSGWLNRMTWTTRSMLYCAITGYSMLSGTAGWSSEHSYEPQKQEQTVLLTLLASGCLVMHEEQKNHRLQRRWWVRFALCKTATSSVTPTASSVTSFTKYGGEIGTEKPMAGAVCLAAVALSACVAVGVQHYVSAFEPLPYTYISDLNLFFKGHGAMYLWPTGHVTSFVVGVLTAFCFHRYSHVRFGKAAYAVCWTLSVVAALTVLYSVFDWNSRGSYVLAWVSTYAGLHRLAWGLAVSWVVFVCATGQAALVNRLLSLDVFVPLSRLTYCGYLVQMLVISTRLVTLRHSVYFTHWLLVRDYLGHLVLIYMFAYLMYLLCECPTVKLSKMALNGLTHASSKDTRKDTKSSVSQNRL